MSEKNKEYWVKELGSHAGYCPVCSIAIGSFEIGRPCLRCGEPIEADMLLNEAEVEVHKQNLTQRMNARAFPMSERGAYDWIRRERCDKEKGKDNGMHGTI